MGVEVWAFAALITVLVAYLLPFLVRRREVAGQSNVQDRYSAELRVLDTGGAAADPDDTCERQGHAELFRRRPEVRVMNRPAVRNVRALRTERELSRARKAHLQARERRRTAASHRGVVACVLLGVALGAWVVGALTALPWWPALVPTVLLGASMVAGRRAARASASADQRERRRIAELERELTGLTGRRPAVPVVARKPQRPQETDAQPGAGGTESSEGTGRPDFDDAVLSGEGRDSVHVAPRFVQESFRARAVSARSERTASRGRPPARPRRTEPGAVGVPARADSLPRPDRLRAEGEAGRGGGVSQGAQSASAGAPGTEQGGATRDGAAQKTAGRTGRARRAASGGPREGVDLGSATSAGESGHADQGEGRRAAERGERDGAAGRAAGRTEAAGASAQAGQDGRTETEAGSGVLTPSTPPQGWKPVHVPAPTYTLAARAPRRAYSEPVLDEGESAPVPARPHSVRTFSTPDFEEQEFQPIDLDAILERRRAAGE